MSHQRDTIQGAVTCHDGWHIHYSVEGDLQLSLKQSQYLGNWAVHQIVKDVHSFYRKASTYRCTWGCPRLTLLRGLPIGTAKNNRKNKEELDVKLTRYTVNSGACVGTVHPVLAGCPALLQRATFNNNNKNPDR